jgi:predicted glycosyltransferase
VTRPTLLLWCQHSVGMGHLVRSLTLAGALARRFDVVLLSGGTFPAELAVPPGVRMVPLPPIGHEADYTLVSREPGVTVEQAQARRVERILAELHACAPDVLMIELYPFGRRKFAFELLPLLDAARDLPRPPVVVCSVRDILVASRRDQARHDEQAAQVANRYLDAVLVHADERFARLEESFQPATPLAVPVVYTGFVRREPVPGAGVTGAAGGRPGAGDPEGPDGPPTPVPRVLVSAGGGLVGEPLFAVAAAAAPAVLAEHGLTTTVVTGPFLPDDARAALDRASERTPGCLEVVGFVDDLAGEIARSAVSVSQCGYNTTMDLLSAGTPAVVVPYAEGREDEQTRRARRLADLGAVDVLPAADLTPRSLVDAVGRARAGGAARSTGLRLDGADRTVEAVAALLSSRAAPPDARREAVSR